MPPIFLLKRDRTAVSKPGFGPEPEIRAKRRSPQVDLCLAALPMLSLLAGCSSGKNSQDIATGSHFSVSRVEFDHALATMGAVPKGSENAAKRVMLDRLVEEKLFANAAASEGLDRDPNVMVEIEAAKRAILARAYAARASAAIGAPADTAVKAFYDAHPEAFTQRVAVDFDELVFAGPFAAGNELAKQYCEAQDYADVARKAETRGINLTAQFVATTSDHLPTIVAKNIGQVSAGSNVIFAVQEGVVCAHIRTIHPAPMTFEQAAPIIREGLAAQNKSAFLAKDMARLRSAAAITITEPSLAPVAGKP